MIDYDSLNNDEKRILRNYLGVERIGTYYLEDNNILIMNEEELFEYIYLDEIDKFKDAIALINKITKLEITNEDVNKTIKQKILEDNEKVFKISDKKYVYKDN